MYHSWGKFKKIPLLGGDFMPHYMARSAIGFADDEPERLRVWPRIVEFSEQLQQFIQNCEENSYNSILCVDFLSLTPSFSLF